MEQRRVRERATDRQIETTDPSHKQALASITVVPKSIPGKEQGDMNSTYHLVLEIDGRRYDLKEIGREERNRRDVEARRHREGKRGC